MLFSPSSSLLCVAGLLAVLAGGSAFAQPAAEVEFGGGYHYALDLGSDWFTVPSSATIDTRVTVWTGDRWGVGGRGLFGLGGLLQGHAGIERSRPTYVQLMFRYRRINPEGVGFIVGIGGGLMGWYDEFGFDAGAHLLNVEVLGSKALTERLSFRAGVSMAVPIHVHPTVLLAWGF